MRKRMLAMLMAGIMTVGMLAGCGDGKEAQTNSESKVTSNNVESKESEVKKEDPVTVKWLMFGTEAEDHDMVMEEVNKLLLEKINVQLDFEVIPAGEYEDKVRLANTSGEDFDIVFTSNWRNKFADNIAQEALLPLNDLLAEYGQGIVDSVPEWLFDVGYVGENLYAVPNQQILCSYKTLIVQKEYAEKYDLDVTEVTCEADWEKFYSFWDQILENEEDLIPLGYNSGLGFAMDIKTDGVGSEFSVPRNSDEKVATCDMNYQDAKIKREFWEKGYIRQDIATVTDDSAYVTNNRYVCRLVTGKPGVAAETQSSTGVEWIEIQVGTPYVSAMEGISTMTAINSNSKHPEAAMKLINLMYTDKEVFNMVLFGLEGVHYDKVADNRVEQYEDTKYNYSGMGWAIGNQFNAYYTLQADGTWEETDAINRSAEVSSMRGYSFDSSNVQSELAQMSAVNGEYTNWQYLTDDFETTYAEMMKKYEQAGLETVRAEVQRQVDEFLANR